MNCESCEHDNVEGARFCAGCGAPLPTATSDEDPFIGQLIGGRFRIIGVLGEGGMGKVYAGEQQMGSTVRKVAIKTLHSHLSKDQSVLARFHRECGTVAKLEHPNTIHFFDFGSTDDGTLYIAMEFVEGQPLSDIIEAGGALSPERALHILRQISGALDEAHEQGIVHRDLKPENVVLGKRAGEEDFVKVLDFGIAARTESADAQKEQKLTQQGMVLGTPPYMSPEQFTGKALDRRSDIYSLGVMAYEMLTGTLPFQADTPWQWATEHMTAQPRPFGATPASANVPPGMRDAIMRALEKDPEQRQATARQFLDELVSGVAGAAQAGAYGSTAAMPAAPDFSTAAPPLIGDALAPYDDDAIQPPIRKTGKGLIVALSLAGVLLLVAIAVVAAQSASSEDEAPAPLFSAASDAEVVLDALIDGTDASTSAPPEVSAVTQSPQQRPPQQRPVTGISGGKAKPPTTTPTGKQTTEPEAPQPQTQPGSGDTSCAACLTAAAAGNIPAAAAAFARCTDAGQKQACTARARGPASSAARAAAKSGNCSLVKVIAQGSSAMGIKSGHIDKAVAGCK